MKRRREPEIMDDEALDARQHADALRGLRRINALSFTAQTLWPPLIEFARTLKRPIKVLDLATGGGDVPIGLFELARRDHVDASFSGCDKSDVALDFARKQAHERGASVQFFKLDVLAEPIPNDFDVIVNSLFLHHFDPNDVVRILKKLSCARMVLVSDLSRSRAGLVLSHLATRLLSRSPVVHTDGPRSVHAAYTMSEMRSMALEASMVDATISPRWPYRMLLHWKRS